ncbi:hypothetical protein CCACVL1_02724 [Corchorus capsularis]|uniref:Uncharacterized protein n=1 Tax=Corchorus capsularis TaxID=210143 RepID=A0A1R3K6T0_COCAP|nr:hypothetical protein CCACVL1_02724 [Corchorus capsularis]
MSGSPPCNAPWPTKDGPTPGTICGPSPLLEKFAPEPLATLRLR